MSDGVCAGKRRENGVGDADVKEVDRESPYGTSCQVTVFAFRRLTDSRSR